MNNASEQRSFSRRDVLRQGALTSGALVLGTGALTGQASGTAQRAFVYQRTSDSIPILGSKLVELLSSRGRKKISCGSTVQTEEFDALVVLPSGDQFKTLLWFTPSSLDPGDWVVVTSLEEECPDAPDGGYSKYRVTQNPRLKPQ